MIALFLLAFLSVSQAANRNIIIVIADDLSPSLGCYGDKAAVTPNLDALAKDAVVFDHAYATTASCSASRSVVLTGLHNHANGHYGHLHSYHKFSSYPWVKTLPVLLSEVGYRTARIGKHHNGPEEVYLFEEKLPGNSRSTVEMADNCREFIKGEKPFFLYYATSDPHRGGGFAKELPYAPDRFGNKPNKGAYPGVEEVLYDPDKVTIPPFLPDTPETRAELAQYYQSVSRVDTGVGRLVEILKEEGKYDDTLILFTADHGMAFSGGKTTVYEGGLKVPFIVRDPHSKRRGIRNQGMISFIDITPTLLDYAGGFDRENRSVNKKIAFKAPRRRGQRPNTPYNFHGRSFLPILDEKEPKGWDGVNASHTFHEIQMYYPMRVVRDRKYKLIWNIAHPLPYPFASDLWAAPSWQAQHKKGMDAPYGNKTVGEYIQRPEFELFDMELDPDEYKNLAYDPAFAKVLEEYKKKLKQFQRAYDDPWVMKWDYE